MFIENIRQFYTIIDSNNDELHMIRQIALSLKQKLGIDIAVADKKGSNLLSTPFKSENYFYKIPLKAMNVKYGMIYANGIDSLSQNDLAFFYSAVPLISILLKNIYTRNELYIKQQIRSAIIVIGSLTVTELRALRYVFELLHKKTEGIIIISKIADQTHITRSVIVNALKKIESAGIIDSRSLGMKGTKIKVNNKYFVTELRNS